MTWWDINFIFLKFMFYSWENGISERGSLRVSHLPAGRHAELSPGLSDLNNRCATLQPLCRGDPGAPAWSRELAAKADWNSAVLCPGCLPFCSVEGQQKGYPETRGTPRSAFLLLTEKAWRGTWETLWHLQPGDPPWPKDQNVYN